MFQTSLQKKPSRFCLNSVHISMLTANLTPRKLNLFGLEILDMDSMNCQLTMMLTSSSKLNKFHGATLNVGGSQVLQLSLSPNKDFMLKTQCNKRIF